MLPDGQVGSHPPQPELASNYPTPPSSDQLLHEPPGPQSSKGLAITALVLGIAAVLTAFIPVVGAVFGIAAIVLAVLALKRRQSKGLSVTGLVLGALSTITSLIVTFALVLAGSLFGAAINSIENGGGETITGGSDSLESEDSTSGEMTAEEVVPDDIAGGFERISWDAYDVIDAPASTSEGTVEDPHPLGTRFAVDDVWEVVVNMVDLDAEEQVVALMPEAAPAPDGKRYVLVNMTLKSLVDEPKEVGTLGVKLDVPGKLISERNTGTASPDPALFRENLQITGNYTGYLAYLIDDVDAASLWLSDGMSTSREVVAVE